MVQTKSSMAHERLDRLDLKILGILQEDTTLSVGQLAETVGLSTTPCWKRIQKLEAAGVIRKRVALLNARHLGLGLTAFISIKTNQHKIEWFDSFHRVVSAIPEVVELNIGHFLIGEAVFVGLPTAIAQMRAQMDAARG